MFRVITENPISFAMEKVGEDHETEQSARDDIRNMIENGSHAAFWVINTETNEIL